MLYNSEKCFKQERQAMFQIKNLKLYFIVFLLFTLAADSMACVLSFQSESKSKSKWMSQEKLTQVIQELEPKPDSAYQLQYRDPPLNIRHTSLFWISYTTLKQYANDLPSANAAREYRIRYKSKLPKQPSIDPVLNQPIEVLELSTRLFNALKGDFIYSIGDLIQRTEQDLFKIPNIGKRSVQEIKDALAQHGLTVGMRLNVFHPELRSQFSTWMSQEVLVQAVENHLENTNLLVQSRLYVLRFPHRVYQLQYRDPSLNIRHTSQWISYETLKQYANDLSSTNAAREYRIRYKTKPSKTLTGRTHITLLEEGIYSIKDLLQKSEQDLLKVPNIGKKEIKEIKDALAQHGFALKPSTEVLDQKVEDYLDLETRWKNVLPRERIFTMRDLLQRSEQDLLSLWHIGDRYVAALKAQLAQHGLTLGSLKPETAKEIEIPPDIPQEVLDQPIDVLELTPRPFNALNAAGIHSIRDLMQRSEQELKITPNLGKKSLAEIKDALAYKFEITLNLINYTPPGVL